MPGGRQGKTRLSRVTDPGISRVKRCSRCPHALEKLDNSTERTVGFCHVDSCPGTCLAGCPPPGGEGLSPSPQAELVLLSPSPHLLLLLYIGYKVDLFVCFLSLWVP